MKQIDKITIILTVFIVIFTGVLFFGAVYSGEEGSTAAGEASYASYFDPEKITTVNLTISDEDWQDMLENPLAEEYHLCNVEINGDSYEGAAIRMKGMTSLSQVASSDSDRYSFKIKSDEYVKDQTFKGLTKFVLNNNYQDATYMKEYLSYQMMTELGVPTPLFSYAAVDINGVYYGLYLMVQAVEDDFAERNFGADFGNLYKPESMGNGGGGGSDGKGNMPGNGKMPEGFGNISDFQGGFPGNGDFMMQQFGDGNGFTGNSMMQQTGNENGFAGNPMMRPGAAEMPADAGNAAGFGREFGNGFDRNMSKDMPGDFGGFGGFGGGGTDLVYTDDSLTSYSNIFDNAVFSRTDTTASEVRVVEALKHLAD
ncbi:MAG TPA: CotH kinase family protein, partial [Methanocorpusculum sp.]|nr:CotH kinase family protein [Methanocorpusculum sp.]